MLYPVNNIDYKLPNGELIGGYLALKGNIKEIEKYKGNELSKKSIYWPNSFIYSSNWNKLI